jgi:predicted MPP superfamily phosphohydrolase
MKKLTRRQFLISLFGLGVTTVGYGRFVEPFWLETSRHQLRFPKKPLNHPVRILHLADLHDSDIIPYDFINKAVDLGLSHRPDLICITGDFCTTGISDFGLYTKILSKLSTKAPTFASLGNHDGGSWVQSRGGYRDTTEVQRLLKESGIRCLVNGEAEVVIKDQPLRIVGLGDLWAQELRPERALGQQRATDSIPTILLSHNPDSKDALLSYDWDLMLSGHTHGGQLRIPLVGTPYSPVRDKRYLHGLHNHLGKWIHITKGVGNVFGVRLNCRPQVSLIDMA